MNNTLSEDSQAMLLICSNLAITQSSKEYVKPYTLREWNNLANKLIKSSLNSPKAFFHHSNSEWKDSLNLTDNEVDRLKRLLNNGAQLAFELEKLSSSGIWITTRAESTYPTLLKDRLKQKCPIFLYCAGNYGLFKTKGVGIVGSRNIDEKALEYAKLLSKKCTLDGYTIVSGGAKGSDSVSQNEALQNDGTVISIVSDSLASKIRNREYREAIMKNNLLMVSAVHPNMTFKVYNAMDRNKYIYSLSQFAVAISSDYDKGGTWAGAIENLKNNWIPMFVRKENDVPKGNIALIEKGAIPLSREEILDKNITVNDWLMKRKIDLNKSYEKQMTIEDISKLVQNNNENKKAKENDIKNTEQIKTENTESDIIQTCEINKEEVTALDILKPRLLENLKNEKTIDELSKSFDVKKSQMQEWIKELVIEQYVKKLNRPVRYKSIKLLD